MNFRLIVVTFYSGLLAACQSVPAIQPQTPEAKLDRQWHASTLDPKTIDQANAAIKGYEKCLNDEALGRVKQQLDPRDIGDQVLQNCEPRLSDIKTVLRAEQVPDEISERYMRQTRSRGAQSLMRFLQAVQAQRTADEASRGNSAASKALRKTTHRKSSGSK